MESMTIVAGHGMDGRREAIRPILLHRGMLVAVVGNTGAGKSRLVKDVEQLVAGDSVTGRTILLDGQPVESVKRNALSEGLVAHLGQNMRFMLDMAVGEFIRLHASCRGREVISTGEVLALCNSITAEHVEEGQHLNMLSGGQTRALMIADIALVCDSPVVLIDEIENAGIDKVRALEILTRRDKLTIAVTHDPHTALLADMRIVVQGGAILRVVSTSAEEKALCRQLAEQYTRQRAMQELLRKGEMII